MSIPLSILNFANTLNVQFRIQNKKTIRHIILYE